MKKVKKLVALVLSIAIIMCSTLPSLATGNDVEQTITSKIVEQLKEDLGEEKATEILNSDSESLSGKTESSTSMDSNNGNDETTVEGSDNEESVDESGSGGKVVEEPEEDSTEISTEISLNNIKETNAEDITIESEKNENIATSSDLEKDSLLLEVEEIEADKSNFFGTTSSKASYYYDETNRILHYCNELPMVFPDGYNGYSGSFTGSSVSLGGTWVADKPTKIIIDDELENLDTCKSLFQNFINVTTIENISNINFENVTNMESMFKGCESLLSIDLSNVDTSNVTNMGSMFFDCSLLTELDLSDFNTSNVTFMQGMFKGCSLLEDLDISNFDVSSVSDMGMMFYECSSLNELDISSFICNNNSLICRSMFKGCTLLHRIYVGNQFDLSNNINAEHNRNNLFTDCTSIEGGNSTLYDATHTDNVYARIDAPGTPGYFTLSGSTGPILNSISVNLPPTKVKYKVGEHFDPAGLKIDLNYSDSTTDSVIYSATTMSAFTFTPATTSELTMIDTNITIGYGNKTTTQVIEVIEPTSISVKPNTNLKVKYAIGESFDPTNLYINVTYSDTTTVETISYTGNESAFSFSPGTLDTAGTSVPITITWTNNGNDYNCTQNVEVVELSSISVNLPPTTTRYIKGTNFDPTGLKINLNYSDSTTETVTYSTATSTNFTFNGVSTLALNAIGNPFEITIGYAGKTCTQNVIVAELSGIAITTHATKLNYNAGDTFDPTGLVITLTYSDSVTEPITYTTTTSSDFTFSPSGTLSRTGNVITIQYKTFDTMTMEETLNVKELTSIAVTTNPAKLSYASGQSLNPNGLVLTLTYTDSNDAVTTDTVTYNSTTQNKFAFNPSGVLTSSGNITITYDGKTGTNLNPTFSVNVRQVASISVVNAMTTSYNVGDRINPNNLVIRVNYQDGNSENVSYSTSYSADFTFNPSLTTNLNTGHTSVTVTYGGRTTTFPISVTQSSGGYVPSGGGGSTGGSGGSGGGGGGGGSIPSGNSLMNNTPVTTQISTNKIISAAVDSNISTWVSNPATGQWKLNITLGDGQVAPASNGFFLLTTIVTQLVNNVPTQTQVNSTYYFDSQGSMVTGWVKTADSKWYFFENAKNANEGSMITGWKEVQGSWYYFTPDGSMMVSGITPDGFMIGADGKWVQ